ncbi:TPA: hypothetical protein ACKPYR_001659 [Stenotrophomonas maltophilia]
MNVGQRLMALGAGLLLAVGVYFGIDRPSAAKLETDNFIQEVNNRAIQSGLRQGKLVYSTAEERLYNRRWIAVGPAALGLLLLGIGWAVSGRPASQPSRSAVEDSD